jgi:hypothetical protein
MGYHFSWLHIDTQGAVRDQTGCTPLVEGDTADGFASGSVDCGRM